MDYRLAKKLFYKTELCDRDKEKEDIETWQTAIEAIKMYLEDDAPQSKSRVRKIRELWRRADKSLNKLVKMEK